jgi:hypothetical protein
MTQFHLQMKLESQQNEKKLTKSSLCAMLAGGVLANKQQKTAQPVLQKETKHKEIKQSK